MARRNRTTSSSKGARKPSRDLEGAVNREPLPIGRGSVAPASSPKPFSNAERPPLVGYEVIIAVCGGIAAYKSAALVSTLVQAGAGVTAAMTDAARRFITPLTFQALTARPVHVNLWEAADHADMQHLHLTERADLLIVAPATANMLAKIALGLADDLVSTMVMSADCDVLLAPAMNVRMWENPIVRENVMRLRKHGYHVEEPTEGWLACRSVGRGRMAEPQAIFEHAEHLLKRSPAKTIVETQQ